MMTTVVRNKEMCVILRYVYVPSLCVNIVWVWVVLPPYVDSDYDDDVQPFGGFDDEIDEECEEEARLEADEEEGEEEIEEEMEMEGGGEEETDEDPWKNYVPDPPSMFDREEEVDTEGLLYEGATISVLAASTFIWSLAKSAGWRREHVNELLEYMHDVLLPAGNKLPKTMYRLQQKIGEPDIGGCTYRMCPDGCLLWHKRDEWRLRIRPNTKTQCPKCHKPLFKEVRGQIVPSQTCIYFGIASMIK